MSPRNPEAPIPVPEIEGFKVGDMVQHPFREEIVPILWVGTQVYKFTPRAYAGKPGRVGAYDAIEGSLQYQELEANGGFVKELIKSEPSAEIDLSTDIEKRTLVVPLHALKKA